MSAVAWNHYFYIVAYCGLFQTPLQNEEMRIISLRMINGFSSVSFGKKDNW